MFLFIGNNPIEFLSSGSPKKFYYTTASAAIAVGMTDADLLDWIADRGLTTYIISLAVPAIVILKYWLDLAATGNALAKANLSACLDQGLDARANLVQ